MKSVKSLAAGDLLCGGFAEELSSTTERQTTQVRQTVWVCAIGPTDCSLEDSVGLRDMLSRGRGTLNRDVLLRLNILLLQIVLGSRGDTTD